MMIFLLLLIAWITSIFKFYNSFHIRTWSFMTLKSTFSNKPQSSDVHDADKSQGTVSLNDLPEPILEIILEKLSSNGLFRMSTVSTFLREKCICDHLWERHLRTSKWSKIIGTAVFQEWQRHLVTRNDPIPVKKRKGLIFRIMQKLSLRPPIICRATKLGSALAVDSILAMYLALENGTFWFPAQIYNRQNGHVGFMLSCYDAQLCYDHKTDTFQARYPAYGMLDVSIEKNVTWDRLRVSPVNTTPYDIFHSDSLKILRPDDHLEIQWRRNKELPYGWWYVVVGHLDSCSGNQANCHCATSDMLVLEFKQYSLNSRWRKTLINRNDDMEKGNVDIGYYGGMRKMESCEEISIWLRLWPSQILEGV